MPLSIKCPSCSRSLEVPEKYAGKSFKCSACAWQITIPEPPAGSDDLPPLNVAGARLQIPLGNIDTPYNRLSFECAVSASRQATLQVYIAPEDGRKSDMFLTFDFKRFTELKEIISKAEEVFQRCYSV